MWWRIIILFAVMLFLGMASMRYFWRFPRLVKIYRLLEFQGRLEPTQQAVHFAWGMVSLAMLRLLSDILGLSFMGEWIINIIPIAPNSNWWYFIAAVVGAITKEISDVIATKKWHRRDSIVDACYWVLGGIVAPLLKMYL